MNNSSLIIELLAKIESNAQVMRNDVVNVWGEEIASPVQVYQSGILEAVLSDFARNASAESVQKWIDTL